MKKVVENKEQIQDSKFDLLSNFIDANINKDEDGIASSWSSYLNIKAKEMIAKITEKAQPKEENDEDDADEDHTHLLKNRDKKKAPLKKMKKETLKEFTGENSPIKLKGDDVYVSGKLVGSITNDLSDINKGILFTSADGKFKKEVNTIREMYAFLLKHYNVTSETRLGVGEE